MMNKPSVQRDNSGALTIKISSDAVNHIRNFGNLEGKNKTNLRVAVKGGGCSGLTYVLEFIIYWTWSSNAFQYFFLLSS